MRAGPVQRRKSRSAKVLLEVGTSSEQILESLPAKGWMRAGPVQSRESRPAKALFDGGTRPAGDVGCICGMV